MPGIRVTYSGLISLITSLTSIFPSMIFMLIVTRMLSPEEFGTWGLIGGLTTYVVIVETISSYWTTRETARGIESGKTAVFSSGFFSIGGVIAYLIISYFVGGQTDANQDVLFFSAILIPVIFLNRILTAINLGWKPHTVNIGVLSFAIAQIPLAIIFLYFLHMGVIGVILTVTAAYIINNIILIFYARDKLRNKIKVEFLKKWLRLFWLPLYPATIGMLIWLDVVIFSIITGSVVGLAFWTAAMFISKIITNAGLVSSAVYPKLLQGSSREYFQDNLTLLLYFAIPLTALAMTFAKPGLFALNPLYVSVFPVAVILSIHMFFFTLSGVFQLSLIGIEKVDVHKNSTSKDFLKSKLFFVPTTVLIQYVIYLSLLIIGLLLLLQLSAPQSDLLLFWAILALTIQLPFTIYFFVLVRRNFPLKFDFSSIIKYLLISIGVFGMTYVLTEHFLIYKDSVFEFIPDLLLFVGTTKDQLLIGSSM